nr:methyl-accepting chemotaxis protein [Candidatus Pantoea persica]
MKVGARLGIAFGVIVALMVIIGVPTSTKTQSINRGMSAIVDDCYVKVRLAFDVRDGVNDQIKFLRGMVIDTNRPERNVKRFNQLAEVKQRTNTAMKRIADIQVTSVGKKKIQGLMEAGEAFESEKGKLIDLIKAGDFDGASNFALLAITPAQNAFLEGAAKFANSQDSQLRAEGQSIVSAAGSAITITLVCAALAIIAAILLDIYLTRSIVRPLNEAVAVAERVAAGDLSSKIAINSREETGVLMRALQQMNDNLLSIVTEVRTDSNTIAVASNQISSGNLALSKRTEQQASSLEETASAMEQMTSTVKHTTPTTRVRPTSWWRQPPPWRAKAAR